MTTTQTLPHQQQWLPTLSSIVIDGESFSQELIRQFDKKRSRLHAEMGGDSTSFSSDSCNSRTRTPESVATPQVPELAAITQDENDVDDNDSVHLRRRSAGELLRRSSAYLRAKFEAFNKSIAPPPPPLPLPDQQGRDISSPPPSEEQRRSVFQSWSLSKKSQQKSHAPAPPHTDTIFNNSSTSNNSPNNDNNNDAMASSSSLSSVGSLPPTKIAVNTTISIPSPYYLHHASSQQPAPHHSSLYQYSAAVQPPVITQYPPRPLKYAPVEPISDHDIPCRNNNNHVLSTPSSTHPDNNNKRSPVPRTAALGPQHHRISLPLFKMVNNNNNNNNTMTSSSPSSSSVSLGRPHSRRSSESDLHRLAAATSKSSLSTWTKTARRFSQWFNCHPINKTPPPRPSSTITTSKKGKEPRNTTTTTTADASTRVLPTTTTNLEVHSLAI